MARKCAVLKCRSGYKQKKSVFKFPVEKTRRQKWIELLKPLKPISLDYSGVCELHFSTESFCEEALTARRTDRKNLRLRPDAIPSIYTLPVK